MSGLLGFFLGELFSVVLGEGISSWVGRRGQRADCPACGTRSSLEVENGRRNPLCCQGCGRVVQQFVNATKHTINRDRTLVAAGLADAYRYVDERPSLGEQFQLDLYLTLLVINSANQPVAVHTRIGEPRRQPFYEDNSGLIQPRGSSDSFQTRCSLPMRALPRRETTVFVETSVYNAYGDRLESLVNHFTSVELYRELIRRASEHLWHKERRLMNELTRLENQGRLDDPYYSTVVLSLAHSVLDC